MGRQVRRVPVGFDWPLEKVWKGFINPFYEYSHQCESCKGSGYSKEAQRIADQWYGKGEMDFDPVAYGATPLRLDNPALVAFATRNVTRSPEFYCRYDSEETAIEKEKERLWAMWSTQWSHHLIDADVQALIEADRLSDFTHRRLSHIPLEEYIRTHAYFLWVEAGRPDGDGKEFWNESAEKHEGHWLPFKNGYVPTAQEINDWNILSMGHDTINSHVCINARCKREGIDILCPNCGGDGREWNPPEMKQQCKEWTETEPPTGEAYQVWETVSEGSPISPAFADPRDLANWMANSPSWGAQQPMSASRWLEWIVGPGWAPSAIMVNGKFQSGVEAMTNG